MNQHPSITISKWVSVRTVITLTASALLTISNALPLLALTTASEREPICRQESVLEAMERDVRVHNFYARIDQDDVAEIPGDHQNNVRCGVCVLSLNYDARRFQMQPARWCEYHEFRVQALRHGFIVRPLR